jgi:hypothetical protein
MDQPKPLPGEKEKEFIIRCVNSDYVRENLAEADDTEITRFCYNLYYTNKTDLPE